MRAIHIPALSKTPVEDLPPVYIFCSAHSRLQGEQAALSQGRAKPEARQSVTHKLLLRCCFL